MREKLRVASRALAMGGLCTLAAGLVACDDADTSATAGDGGAGDGGVGTPVEPRRGGFVLTARFELGDEVNGSGGFQGSWNEDDPDSPIAAPDTLPLWLSLTSDQQLTLATRGTMPIDDAAQRLWRPVTRYDPGAGALVLGETAPELLRFDLTRQGNGCTQRWLEVSDLHLVFLDTDADGAADRVEGHLEGTAHLAGEGLVGERPFVAHLTGALDDVAPVRLGLPGGPAASPIGPTEAITFHFDEPVQLGPAAALVVGDERFALQAEPTVASLSHTLVVRTRRPLPWGAQPEADLQFIDAAGNGTAIEGDLGLVVAPAPAANRDLSTGEGFALRGDVVGHGPDVAVGEGDVAFLFGGPGDWRADFVHTGGGMLAFELTALGALDLSAATLVIDLHGEDLDTRIRVGPDPMSQPVDAATTLRLSGATTLGRSPKLVFETPLPASPVSVGLWAIPNQQMMCGGFFATQALAVSVEVR